MAEDRDTQIRERAHELWEQAGRPEGKAVEHWLQAERELSGDDARDPEAEASGADADLPPKKRTATG